MLKCLVTGGAGFIGSNLTDRLIAEGFRVRVLDNFSTGKKENLPQPPSRIELIKGDVRDIRAVKKAAKGMNYVFHLAALGSVARSVEDPAKTNDVNVTGTLNILLAARDARVKRVIFASSSSVYEGLERTAAAFKEHSA